MGLKSSHVQIGDEIHNSHSPCHKGYLVLLVPKELDHLKRRHTVHDTSRQNSNSNNERSSCKNERKKVVRNRQTTNLKQSFHHATRY